MRLLCFVDLHGDGFALRQLITRAKSADLVICAGDISNFEHNLDKLLAALARVDKKVLMIHGNHEGIEIMKEECEKHPNLVFLHRGLFEYNGVSFMGYGGGGFSKQDLEFEKFAQKVSNHLKDQFVLITHAPAYGTKVDDIHHEHCGNKSIREFILSHQPVLAVSGHLHETAGADCTLGKSRLINPGKKGKLVSI